MTSILEKYSEIDHNGCFGLSSILDAMDCLCPSFKDFLSSTLFPCCRDNKLVGGLIQTIEKLLLALTKLFPDRFRMDMTGLSLCTVPLPQNCYCMGEPSAQNINMEFDVTDDYKDTYALAARSSDTSVISLSPRQLRLELIFSPVLLIFMWEVLLDLMIKEKLY